MKYIKNKFIGRILILFLFSISATNCTDLTESNLGIVSPETYFQDASSVEASISGIYKSFNGSWSGFGYWSFHLNSGSDVQQSGEAWTYLRDFENLSVKPDNYGLTEIWKCFYNPIKAANMTISGINELEDNILTVDQKNEYLSMAYYARALAYFYLVRWWGDIPMFTENTTADYYAEITRIDQAEIYKLITADLTFAEKYLENNYVGFPGKPTSGAAKTLLSKVYLTMAGWPLKQTEKYALAAAKAKEVMDMGEYQLLDNCAGIWKESNNNSSEHIFSFQFLSKAEGGTGASSWHIIGATVPSALGGWSEWYAEQAYFDDFPDGERKDATFITEVDGKPYTEFATPFPHCKKFIEAGNGGMWSSSNNLALFRYAEVLLIFAEAQNLSSGNPNADAYAAVNAVRNRAGLGNLPTGLSKDDFDNAVMNERKWELGFEVKRWFDLQRKELVLEINSDKENVTVDDMLFPIPQREIDVVGPSLTQNPGYN